MKISDNERPSNRNFGFFFSAVFLIISAYFYYIQIYQFAGLMLMLMFVLVVFSSFKPDLLDPLNKAWMTLGLLLGKIITPLILGVIFFGIFSPIAIFFKIIGRDELRLEFKLRKTYWKSLHDKELNFNNQF